MMKKSIFVGVALLALLPAWAEMSFAALQIQPPGQKHKISLINGAVVEGEIVGITKTEISIKDPSVGVITIARGNILKIEPPLAEEPAEVPSAGNPVALNPGFQVGNAKPLRLFLGAGLTIGGDILATLYLTSGAEENIRAGSIVEIKGGVDYRIVPRVSLRGNFGFHFNQISAGSDGDLNFTRFPVEAMALVHVDEKISLGVGVRKALAASLKGTKTVAYYIDHYTFESSLSLIVQAEYRLNNVGIILRYVNEKYRVNSFWAWNDGSHVGVEANYYF